MKFFKVQIFSAVVQELAHKIIKILFLWSFMFQFYSFVISFQNFQQESDFFLLNDFVVIADVVFFIVIVFSFIVIIFVLSYMSVVERLPMYGIHYYEVKVSSWWPYFCFFDLLLCHRDSLFSHSCVCLVLLVFN